MFNKDKNKKQHQSTWSLSMIEELKKYLSYGLQPGEILFLIKERETSISFNVTTIEEHTIYRGGIPYKDLEDIYVGLSTWENEDLKEEYQNYLGYIEILNGVSFLKQEEKNVPMIRGFIKKDFSFFESINKMLIESRLFNKQLALSVIIDFSGIDNIPSDEIYNTICAERILNIKLPIKEIEITQRVSFD
ncbi:MAG: hypothetical protein Q7U10_11805 [Thermodesulfovibrionia bacterium]|nr:hypothetical protein [Thermodesulfovibrionia bacterium]